jgi:acyl-coenzyme A synthetase/AMP-(fatty) acid ligase
VGENGLECAQGGAGEIRLRTQSLFSGYLDAPSSCRPTPDGDWLATGDWGRLGSQGELYVFGRRRNLLKHGGATFAPLELEVAAELVAGAEAAAAISLSRPGLAGDTLVLVVEASLGVSDSPAGLAREIAETVRREVGILPGEVLLVLPGTLPRTESGKLRHSELAQRLAEGSLDRGRVLAGRPDGWRR